MSFKRNTKKMDENKRRKNIYLVVMMVFITTMLVVLFSFYNKHFKNIVIQPRTVKSVKYNAMTDMWREPESLPLEENKSYLQKITMNCREISGITLFIVNNEEVSKGKLIVTLIEDKTNVVVKKWVDNISNYSGEVECHFYLDSVKKVKKDDVYRIEISVENIEGHPIRLKQTYGGEKKGTLYIDGEKKNEMVFSYSVFTGNLNALKYFYFFVALGLIATVSVATFLVIKKTRLEIFAFIITFFLGGMYIFVIPFFAAPDEYWHFVTVYAKSSILLGEEVLNVDGKVVGGEDAAMALSREEHPNAEEYVKCIRGIAGKIDEDYDTFVELCEPIEVSGIGYIPQMVGVTLGRLLELNGFQIFFLGRMFALIFYAAVLGLAIKILPFGKNIMFVIGILPMTLQQSVSFSYDSVLNGIVLLTISYILYLAFSKEKVEKKEMLIVLLLGSIIISIKFIYFSIAGLVFLIPKEKFHGLKKKIESVVLLFGGGFICIIILKMKYILKSLGIIHQMGEADLSVNSSTEVGYYTILYCIKHPIELMELIIRTISDRTSFYFESMLGSWLGWLDIKISSLIIMMFASLLLFCALQREEEYLIKKSHRKVFVFVSLVTILEVIGVFIFSTYQGADYIWGIQGRYFLPILPLLLMSLKNTILTFEKKFNYSIILSAVFLEIVTIREIMSTVIYGHAIWQ